MNLEALRHKRVKRMRIKSKNYMGPRRIFFVLDRGTRKFQGDLGLWIQYIEFAKKEKSYKKLGQIFSKVLRLHPTKPELWIYAAHHAMDVQADMTMARTYMQRGLRFCRLSQKLWLEYAKLEMMYVAKVAARQQILGLNQAQEPRAVEPDLEEPNADKIALPSITAEDIEPSLTNNESINGTYLQKLASSPAFTGAIPIAIFDAAVKVFGGDVALMERFFDMFAEFDRAPPVQNILKHVMRELLSHHPESVACGDCRYRLPLVGVDTASADFPSVLAQSLDSLNKSLEEHPASGKGLAKRAIMFFLPLAQDQELDYAVRRVLTASIRKFLKYVGNEPEPGGGSISVIRLLEGDSRLADAHFLTLQALKLWPSDSHLRTLQLAVRPASEVHSPA